MEHRVNIPPGLPRPDPTISYWQDPPHPLSSTRTTTELPTSADYVIIGSGISGALIAFNILKRRPNAQVIMLEARTACSGATGRNGGHTKAASYRSFTSHAQAHSLSEAVKIARLEHDNIRATHAFAARHGIACESRPCDTYDVVYDREAWEKGIDGIAAIRAGFGHEAEAEEGEDANGDGDVDPAAKYAVLGAEAVKRQTYCPGADVVGAFRYEAGSISAYKFTMGVLAMCAQGGLNLQTRTPVLAIASSSDDDDGGGEGPTWTATTARGAITTRRLILATNGYTAQLLPALQGRIVPLRGQVTAQRRGARLADLTRPDGLQTTYSFIYADGYDYMIPRPHATGVPEDDAGDIVIGGGLGLLPDRGISEYGEADDRVVNEANSRYLRETLPRYFGGNWGDDGIGGERVKKEWTGVMGATVDGIPFVGEVPDQEGLWICAGFNGHGMVLCLKCAEALTAMLFGDDRVEYEWFPEAFVISQERLMAGKFTGRI